LGVLHKPYVPRKDSRSIGGYARMKDVGWGDILVAVVLAPVLVLPVVLVV